MVTRHWKVLLFVLLHVCVDSGCRHKVQDAVYQPITLYHISSNADASFDSFTPDDITNVKAYALDGPGNEGVIWLQLSPSAMKRWGELPEGIVFMCSTPKGVVGQTKVDHLTMGIGKGGFCFQIHYDDRKAFDAAKERIR